MDTKKLRQKILDLAIRGKLVPQDPNDEPASVLLERICAEKDQLIKAGKIKRGKQTISDKSHYENVPFEIPKTWEWVKLGSICDKIVDGDHNPPKGLDTPTQFLMLSSRNVNHNRIEDLDNVRYISEKVFVIENERTKLMAGDILFTSVGSLGRSCVYQGGMNFCFQRSVSVIHTLINNYWLKYYFDSSYYQNYIIDKATGTAQLGFYLQQLEDSFIAVPPINEQIRIVAEIEKWFTLIDELELNKIELQEFIRQAKNNVLNLAIKGKLVPQDDREESAIELLKRINIAYKPCDTSHYPNLPKGWTICSVGEVANYINGRAFKPSEWEHDGLPIIRIQNLNDINAPYNYTTVSYEDRYKIKKGDLLFAWAASLGTYIWEGGDAWLNQHIFKVEPNAFMDKHFLYYSFINLIAEFYRQSHGSGMVHITKDKFEQTRIMIPPLPEQKRIVQSIENIYNIIDTINAEL